MDAAPAPTNETVPLWAEGPGRPAEVSDAAHRRPTGYTSCDLLVVGLGAAGLQAATIAAERGLDVLGIDAGAIGDGASGRNGGFLLVGAADFHHVLARRIGAARATALYERTRVELESQIELTAAAVRRVGSIRLATTPEEAVDCRAQASAMKRDGLDVEEVRGPFGWGLRFPHDAAIHPGMRSATLAARARQAGVRLSPQTAVTHIDDGHVQCADLRILAGRILVAVDGGLELLVPHLRGHVRTARAQMLATAPTAVSEQLVPAPMYARYGYDYWQRLPDSRLTIGGARDLGGEEEWTVEDGVTEKVQMALERIATDQLDTAAAVTHRWSGRLAFTADRLPVCRVMRPGLAVAGGYCGTGNVMGPLTARAALELLVDGSSRDADLLTASR